MSGYSTLKPELILFTDDLTGNVKQIRLHDDHLLLETPGGSLITRVDNVKIAVYADRPAAGIINDWFYSSDTNQLFIDNGTSWIEIKGTLPGTKLRVYLNASNLSIPNSSATKIPFDAESYDTDNEYDNTINYRFTCNISGYYQIYSQIQHSSVTLDTLIELFIFKNGVSVTEVAVMGDDASYITLNIFDQLHLTAGDYIEIYASQNSGNSKTIYLGSKHTFFTCALLA